MTTMFTATEIKTVYQKPLKYDWIDDDDDATLSSGVARQTLKLSHFLYLS